MSYAHSLSFLLSQAGATSARMFAERLAPLGISPREFAVLSNLDAEDGQSQQRLADALGMHRNNMVGLTDALEERGLLRRQRDLHDRRAFRLRLSEDGRDVVDAAYDLVPDLDRELAAGLTREQSRQLRTLLQRLVDGLGLEPGVHPHLSGRR